MRFFVKLLTLFIVVMLTACTQVKPWEKGTLARKEMAFVVDPTEARLADHVYFAKEASASGSAVSGGGCGCN